MSQQGEQWSNYGFRIFLSTLSHPFEYAKVLIQIGYEPIPPRPSTTFFGKPALKLPNIFQYVKHIKTVDGFTGCYRGLETKVCGSFLSVIATQKLSEYFELQKVRDEWEEQEVDVEVTRRRRFIRQMRYDILTRATAILVSHPFHVMTVRIMAQFIGRETKYSGVLASIGEVYEQNGILGFFSGLIPRLLGDILTVFIANTLTYLINNHVVEEKDLQAYTSATMMFIATAVTYPFQVVSNCMAVSRSGLMAGSPPLMPHYGTWLNCWTDLSKRNQLKRGSSLLIRYYVGPQFTIDSKVMPKMSSLKY